MRVAVLSHGLPQPSSLGGPMTAWALLEQLAAEGHEASVVAFRYSSDPFHSEEREEQVRALGAGLTVIPVASEHELSSPAGTVELRGRPSLERIFPTARLFPAVEQALQEARPDVTFAYHWEMLAASHGSRVAPRLGVVDDPWHMPNLRRWQRTRPTASRAHVYWTFSTLRGIRPVTGAMAELLLACSAAGAFQAETAAWLRRRGVPGCEYLHAPLADGGGPDWAAHRTESANARPRILLGPSQLGATSTRAGLQLFATEILPALERELGPDGFEVRIVGEGDPPPELARLLPRPSVVLTGRIEPADEEFLAADVQLVPTPYVLGKRVRIIVGWSFGCCVVAHAAEAVNLPELQNGVNALLGGDGPTIAAAVVRAVGEPGLARRLGAGGRSTYESLFHPAVAARGLVERLERVAAHS